MTKTASALYKMTLLRLTTVVFLAGALFAAPAEASRLALIVGNSDYQNVSKLRNPANDANAIAKRLRSLDFEVTLLTDPASDGFWDTLQAFGEKAETAESVLFFYSGHAFQLNGINYLVPVKAELTSREAIKAQTWSLDGIIARLQARNRQTLIFLDACRNDPLPSSVRGSGAAADGLARLQTGVGTFVAFATEPGAVTYDGAGDAANSPFTTALLNHIDTPGISVSDMMIQVRNEVEQNTLRRQTPWDQSSLRSQFYFVPEVERKQELSDADYELLAQLPEADRKKFMDLLRASGFSESSLRKADAEIKVASLNLEVASGGGVVIGEAAPTPQDLATALPDEPAATTRPDPAVPAAPEQVASADPDIIPGLPVFNVPTESAEPSLPVFEIIGGTDIGPASPSAPGADSQEAPPVRLAALTWETRNILAINALMVDRLRVQGEQVQPDNDENRALLASIDPRLIEPERAPLSARALASATQTELRRLGCYHMRVDGDWGRGSRTALTSYFLAKKIVPDALEPSEPLIRRLESETKVVCQVRVSKAKVKAGPKAAKAEPTAVVKKRIKREKTKKSIKKNLKTMMGTF